MASSQCSFGPCLFPKKGRHASPKGPTPPRPPQWTQCRQPGNHHNASNQENPMTFANVEQRLWNKDQIGAMPHGHGHLLITMGMSKKKQKRALWVMGPFFCAVFFCVIGFFSSLSFSCLAFVLFHAFTKQTKRKKKKLREMSGVLGSSMVAGFFFVFVFLVRSHLARSKRRLHGSESHSVCSSTVLSDTNF